MTSEKSNKKYIIFWLVIITLISIVISFYFFQFHGGFSSDHSRWGTFGDYIGGIFAFFAFIAVLITIWIQVRQLRITTEELQLSRQEMKNSVEALKNQNDTLLIRNFENTYFELLGMRQSVLQNVHCKWQQAKLKGIDAMKRLYEIYHDLYDSSNEKVNDRVINTYSNLITGYSQGLDDYRRYFCTILRFIDTCNFVEKQKYIELLIALTTQDELILLFYAGATGKNIKGFYDLFEKYKIFKNLNLTKLIHPKHVELYSKEVTNSV